MSSLHIRPVDSAARDVLSSHIGPGDSITLFSNHVSREDTPIILSIEKQSYILELLRKSLGDHMAVYRSIDQKQYLGMVIDALSNIKDYAFILPTSGGKSMAVFCAAFHERVQETGRKTIFILPSLALIEDQFLKLKRSGLEAIVMKGFMDIPYATEVILATPETAVTSGFMDQLSSLDSKGQLGACVIDEFHCTFVHSTFRPAFVQFTHKVAVFKHSPIIQVSATCPPAYEKLVKQYCCLPQLKFVRFNTDRPNIHYFRHILPTVGTGANSNGLSQSALAAVSLAEQIFANLPPRSIFRIIMYCSFTTDVDSLFDFMTLRGLPCLKYHGKLSEKTKQNSFTMWNDTPLPLVIACTDSFNLGLDCKYDVQFVITIGPTRGLLNLAQQAGRLARTPGVSSGFHLYLTDEVLSKERFQVFRNELNFSSGVGRIDPFQVMKLDDINEMQNYEECEGICLRGKITELVDGSFSNSCLGLDVAHCQICFDAMNSNSFESYKKSILIGNYDLIILNSIVKYTSGGFDSSPINARSTSFITSNNGRMINTDGTIGMYYEYEYDIHLFQFYTITMEHINLHL